MTRLEIIVCALFVGVLTFALVMWSWRSSATPRNVSTPEYPADHVMPPY